MYQPRPRKYLIVNDRVNVTLDLTPLHALVGPNDSGKSTLLRSLIGMRDEADELLPHAVLRFDADSLRAPAPLIREGEPLAFADERGAGLASIFDVVLNRDLEHFQALQADVRELFPHVARLGLANVSESRKEVAITLSDGSRVTAKDMSEGLIYFLGFLALKYLDARVLLIESPENGLHPTRVGDVMDILRARSKTKQVVVTTHSPLVLNELHGDEISIVTRAVGAPSQVRLLKDVPLFERAMKVYAPGEFWLSHVDGLMEEPLLTGVPRT